MQLIIRHAIPEQLELPLSYHHIIQAIIYKNLDNSFGYNYFLHDNGFLNGDRMFKMFTFGPLQGKYKIKDKRIVFFEEVVLEIRSPDSFMIRILAENLLKKGISYYEQHFSEVEVYISDETIEETEILVEMQSPICVYSTDMESKKTYFYAPEEMEFARAVSDNFNRKYTAYYGIEPMSDIELEPVRVTSKDKYVTKYKSFYISGWLGVYALRGERKYLDFLYQTGLGSKNAQGFGMFELLE